ncbi:MAG: MBOAT family protein [Clostridium butyricum]|nr:MBOAT family protein [Clostridium butyricum]
MTFNSPTFLIFFPIVALMYFLITPKFRWIWLLVSSYYFYMCWNPKYSIVIAFSTIVTYITGLLLHKSNSILNKKKATFYKNFFLISSLLINLGILFLFKYYNFFSSIVIRLTSQMDLTIMLPTFDFMLPVGISYYTFQVVSYIVDVYRNDIKPEKNLGKYALFVSFFPQIVAGPIEKAKHMLPQYNTTHYFDYIRVKNGLLQMLWGYFKKAIIADRIAVLVNTVFNNPSEYFGYQIVIASLMFTFQIYCDFSGYSDIAIGCAKTMGFSLTTNFKEPYFATSIKDFWKRWHISLTSWFRDYLYIPLGGNRKGKIRTQLNIMIIFLVSGLWHGAALTYVLWGFLHGAFQVIENVLNPYKENWIKKFKININSFSYKFTQILFTFILVNFAWIFFRANSIHDIKIIFKNMFINNPWIFTDGSLFNLGLNVPEFVLVIISIIILILIDYLKTKFDLLDKLSKQNLIFRWCIYIIAVLSILLFGVYGSGYSVQQFIYAQF